MNQQLYVQAEKRLFNRKTGFTEGSNKVKKLSTRLIILLLGVNLLVILMAKLFNGLAK